MDDKLISTIDKIVRLCQENPEFDKRLRKELEIASSPNSFSPNSISNEFLHQVGQYVGLDFFIDNCQSLIDYSFVKNTYVKEQLISDNREMLRFRYGTRYHEVNFQEFCRYAHLQAEMMLNYYYDTINNSDIEAIRTHIHTYNPKANLGTKTNSLTAIPYSVKLYAFTKEHHIYDDTLSHIRNARNDISHRSTDADKIDVHAYQARLKEKGISFRTDGQINEYGIDNPSLKQHIKDIKQTDEYKAYSYKVWYDAKPYDTIVDSLRKVAKKISYFIYQ